MADQQHTSGILALRLRVPQHAMDRLARRGKIPYATAGRIRLFAEADVPKVAAALTAAGYHPEAAPALATAS